MDIIQCCTVCLLLPDHVLMGAQILVVLLSSVKVCFTFFASVYRPLVMLSYFITFYDLQHGRDLLIVRAKLINTPE